MYPVCGQCAAMCQCASHVTSRFGSLAADRVLKDAVPAGAVHAGVRPS